MEYAAGFLGGLLGSLALYLLQRMKNIVGCYLERRESEVFAHRIYRMAVEHQDHHLLEFIVSPGAGEIRKILGLWRIQMLKALKEEIKIDAANVGKADHIQPTGNGGVDNG